MDKTTLMQKLYSRSQMISAVTDIFITLGHKQYKYGTHKFPFAFKQEFEQQVNTGISRCKQPGVSF